MTIKKTQKTEKSMWIISAILTKKKTQPKVLQPAEQTI